MIQFFSKILKSITIIVGIITIIGIIIGGIGIYVYRPDLRIDHEGTGVNWNNFLYIYNIKNYGRSTAEDIKVIITPNYYSEQIAELKELPPNESHKFEFYATFGDENSMNYIKQILADEKAAIINVKIKYKWLGFSLPGSKYTSVIKRDSFLNY